MDNYDFWIGLNPEFSTTKQVVKTKPNFAGENGEDPTTILFLPTGNGRKGEGGLRTKGYFKASLPDKPLITVVTVVFNDEKYIEETILSVINQSYDNVEYVVIDGGSSDKTIDIIRKYENEIDYWVSEEDKGIYDAMNKGIVLATGLWINFMNSGDYFYSPSILGKVFYKLIYPDKSILYGNNEVRYKIRKRINLAGSPDLLWQGSQFNHQSSFISATLHKNNLFTLNYKIAADFNFFYSSQKKGVNFIPIKDNIASILYNGLSDSHRINAVLEFWLIVDKNMKINFYYWYKIFVELIKLQIKKIVGIL